jgi:hypothetical protein
LGNLVAGFLVIRRSFFGMIAPSQGRPPLFVETMGAYGKAAQNLGYRARLLLNFGVSGSYGVCAVIS